MTTEHVLSEGLTLLRQRPGRPEVCRKFAAMLFGGRLAPFVRRHPSDADATLAAVALQFDRYERGPSFTDAALVVLARELGARREL